MDLSKSYDFFDPFANDSRIHIIGCGSVGSCLAENLARCGVTKMTLWDFDTVSEHNIVNQMFRSPDVGRLKVEALRDILGEINPDIKKELILKPRGWNGERLSGIVFLAVDSIELRKKIVEDNMNNAYIKAMFDFRTMLESAQHFAADWSDYKQRENLLNSMQFSDADAEKATPVSACGVTLGVCTTVRIICALGVDNYINFVKGNGLKKLVIADGFRFTIDAF